MNYVCYSNLSLSWAKSSDKWHFFQNQNSYWYRCGKRFTPTLLHYPGCNVKEGVYKINKKRKKWERKKRYADTYLSCCNVGNPVAVVATVGESQAGEGFGQARREWEVRLSASVDVVDHHNASGQVDAIACEDIGCQSIGIFCCEANDLLQLELYNSSRNQIGQMSVQT